MLQLHFFFFFVMQTSHISCRMPTSDSTGKDIRMVLDKESAIEDFAILGRGLVADIGIRSSDSTLVRHADGTPFSTDR